MKKLCLAAAAVLAALTLFASCNEKSAADAPKIVKITAYNKSGEVMPFDVGDTNVDPSLRAIELRFDRAMDTRYAGYVYYDGAGEYILGNEWLNSYTHIFYVSSFYSTNFKIVINDHSYINEKDGWTPARTNWRDMNGTYAEEFSLEYSIKKEPANRAPVEIVINYNDYFSKDYMFELKKNEYADNYQLGDNISPLVAPYKLKKGDVVKFKYKFRADYDLPAMIVNLVDVSKQVNYWKVIAEEEDVSLADEDIKGSTEENPIYYEKEITFHVAEDIASPAKCTIQVTCWDVDFNSPYAIWIAAADK